jgi:IS5 family transposase
MQPKKTHENPDLFKIRLDLFIDMKHELVILAEKIAWSFFEEKFGPYYVDKKGRPGTPIRLMVGLHYLKHAYNESDESVVYGFVENPYWQYFCGYEYFQKSLPIDPSSLTRFRKRIGSKGMEYLFQALLEAARDVGVLKDSHISKVNIDTTVQEKAIAFPTDARLYYKMRKQLVKAAEARGIVLRQNYRRLAKKALSRQSGYSRAKQMRRAAGMTRQLKTYLGRVHRDIVRKAADIDPELMRLLEQSKRLQKQCRDSKDKLYSIHAPETECISKGKAHKRYEFGCKVSLATSSRDNWILGIQAHHGNPYDGHTLKSAIEQVERLSGSRVADAYVDLGYRGHDYRGDAKVHIVNFRSMAKKTRSAKRWLKRRSAIEPVIGHVKSDNGMERNHLKGREGDKINALLSGCGFNMRELLAVFFLPIPIWRKVQMIISQKLIRMVKFA